MAALITPPATGTTASSSRRRQRQENSDKFEGPLGEVRVSVNKGRVGAPPVRDLPLTYISNSLSMQFIEPELEYELVEMAKAVLQKHGIPPPRFPPYNETYESDLDEDPTESAAMYDRAVPGERNSARRTLMLYSDWKGDDCKITWKAAVKEIKHTVDSILYDHGLSLEIDVEMISKDLDLPKYFGIPEANDQLETDWPAILDAVERAIDSHTSPVVERNLSCIMLVKYGINKTPADDNPLTIFIGFDHDCSEDLWPSIEALVDIGLQPWSTYGLRVWIEHFVFQNFVFEHRQPRRSVDLSLKAKPLFQTLEYASRCSMGDELSVAKYCDRLSPTEEPDWGYATTGSFGCHLQIDLPGPGAEIYALTCWHVVRCALDGFRHPPQAEDMPVNPIEESELAKCDVSGLSLQRSRALDLAPLESPSRRLHCHMVECRRAVIAEKTEGLNTASVHNKPQLQHIISHQETALSNNIAFFDQQRHLFAPGIAGSGFRRTRGGHYMDWAVAPVPPYKAGMNKLPDVWEWTRLGSENKHPPETACNMLGQPASLVKPLIGSPVWFRGPKTGLKSGAVNRYKIRHGHKYSAYLGMGRTTECLVQGLNSQGGEVPFSQPGDSGSVVWDKNGQAIGMIATGNPRTGLTVMTPMNVILADIQEFMGANSVRIM